MRRAETYEYPSASLLPRKAELAPLARSADVAAGLNADALLLGVAVLAAPMFHRSIHHFHLETPESEDQSER